jgi:glyoxylase I family protein
VSGSTDTGIVGLHHGAVNVLDWEESIAFYRDTLGLHLLGSGDAGGELMDQATGLADVHLRWAMFRVGGQHLELIQYRTPVPGRIEGVRHDAGATHLAFKVRDVDEAYAVLAARGVRFLGSPVRYPDPVPVGGAFAYAVDPNGVLLEFIEDVAERTHD